MSEKEPPQCTFCDEPAQPEHTPCCSAHGKPLCCEHYVWSHFVQANPCSPAQHMRTRAKAQERVSWKR